MSAIERIRQLQDKLAEKDRIRVEDVARTRDEERVKFSEEREKIIDTYEAKLAEKDAETKRLLDEQQTRFNVETKTLSESYMANTTRILGSLDQANRDRDKAQGEADAWKTRFNNYIKDSVKRD